MKNVLISELLASATVVEREESILQSNFYGQRRVSLIYLAYEFFIFLLLVLLKEISMGVSLGSFNLLFLCLV